MNVLLVGGTGVLGHALVPRLLDHGHAVTVLAPGPRPAPAGAGRVDASLLDIPDDELADALAGAEVVVNVATAVPADPAAPGAWELNSRLREEGTRRLVDAARAAEVAHLVQMSITMVYPGGGDRLLDESTPFDTDPARAGLVGPVRVMEQAVRTYSGDGRSWTVLRGARFAGPGTVQDVQRRRLIEGAFPIAGDGSSWLSMVHVRDFAAAVAATVEVRPPGMVLNIADEPVREREYAERLARAVGAPPPPYDRSLVPELPSQRVSSAAAHRLLGWKPVTGLWGRVA
ncbi:NAD(P)-dependent oxidoreductase [Streptomyces sp. ISL-36]|uniref:NAD-dependent epimerase/dehydratase family protein n=1 Tax=Streptomyces sp. ISL-36 TaxID=2819182 RepID=UPI001BE7C90A|nr:NAD(P)-dependent oxidoreductase [Streptomyces sp. ISL-36]MBT2440134.1 NAD(P)-dependent oxidoreductase [Streptomyces sp. ISL-36]